MQNTVPWRSLTGVVQRFAGAASCSGDGLACQGLQHIRSLDQQLLDAGPCSTSQSCQGWPSLLAHSSLHTSSMQRAQSATSATGTQEDSEEVERKPRKTYFVSMNTKLQLAKPTDTRYPIFFPDITLQMMRQPVEVVDQIKRTGWAREVAFKTTPNVTKLEIKAYLESVYGLKVERVNTINYLGRKYLVPSHKHGEGRPPVVLRGDDWKKAYVTFAFPEGVEPPPPAQPPSHADMLATVRSIKLRTGRRMLFPSSTDSSSSEVSGGADSSTAAAKTRYFPGQRRQHRKRRLLLWVGDLPDLVASSETPGQEGSEPAVAEAAQQQGPQGVQAQGPPAGQGT